MTPAGPRWTGRVELIPEKLDEPLRWRKPRRVFVNSMSDLFHEALPDEAIDRVFAVMALASPRLTFQILTKRAERMRQYVSSRRRDTIYPEMVVLESDPEACAISSVRTEWPLPNVWLGVSCEDQKTADERIPLLLQTPAAVRFVSLEPLLGPVDLRAVAHFHEFEPDLDWVIVGGESGPGARPCDVAWVRSIRDQCKAAGVPVFVKQLGARPVRYECASGADCTHPDCGKKMARLQSAKGGDPAEWPEDLRVREFPR